MGAVKVFIQKLNENTGDKYVVPIDNKECYYDGRYHIGSLNIMEADWEALMESYKGEIFEGRTLPVERVSWDDVQVFIEKLNDLTDMTFRLPTESEWE
jgi:formylglycine-generating enzyme required for sulfatase activity